MLCRCWGKREVGLRRKGLTLLCNHHGKSGGDIAGMAIDAIGGSHDLQLKQSSARRHGIGVHGVIDVRGGVVVMRSMMMMMVMMRSMMMMMVMNSMMMVVMMMAKRGVDGCVSVCVGAFPFVFQVD